MTRARRIAWRAMVVGGLALIVFAHTAAAQTPPRLPQPFAPDWAMLAGWDVFATKGCGKCHAVRGVGGAIGPDLGHVASARSFFDLGAAMWNHLPRMGARMREMRIERPKLSAREVGDVIAFVFTGQYQDESGDAREGEKLFAVKGCVQCHEVGGKGGRVGPILDLLKRANSPVLVAAAMWNHAPAMAEAMQARAIARPTFEGRELVDIIAYIGKVSRDAGGETVQVIPGTPQRGERLFTEKQCVACHAVGGKGAHVGPELGRPGHHTSLTRFAALMWNHGPRMWPRMKERGIPYPRLTGQDMADVLAYLYTSRYFDPVGDAARGRHVLGGKGCLACHSVRGEGGKISADLAASSVVGSPASLIAAMWNHSDRMEAQVEKQRFAWPVLTGQDLADIATFLGAPSFARPRAPAPR